MTIPIVPGSDTGTWKSWINTIVAAIQALFNARAAQSYRWADATARNTQTGMVIEDTGYQTDNGITYRYSGTTWMPTPLYTSLLRTTNQTLTAATNTAISWDTEVTDLGNMHDNTNPTRITVPIAGLYEVTFNTYAGVTTGTIVAYIRKNGTTDAPATYQRRDATAGAGALAALAVSVPLAANDYIEVMVNISAGGAVIGSATSNQSTQATVKRIGPI